MFDIWLKRLSHVSQVLLVFLAIFGYFYTVKPVYEKALLDEQIAEKTLELKTMNSDLAQLKKVNESSTNAKNILERKISESKSILEKQKMTIHKLLMNEFITMAKIAYNNYELVESETGEQTFIPLLRTKNKSPYDVIAKTLKDFGVNNISKEEQAFLMSYISEYLKNHRDRLDTTLNTDLLINEEKKEVAKIYDRYPEDRFKAYTESFGLQINKYDSKFKKTKKELDEVFYNALDELQKGYDSKLSILEE